MAYIFDPKTTRVVNGYFEDITPKRSVDIGAGVSKNWNNAKKIALFLSKKYPEVEFHIEQDEYYEKYNIYTTDIMSEIRLAEYRGFIQGLIAVLSEIEYKN
jgi:hypothetical protein